MDQSLSDFVSEAEDILDSLEDSISQLMDISTDDHRKPDIINAIFRSAHSLKGLSGMLNLDNLSDLSHHVESLLDSVRLNKIALDDDIVDLLSYGVQLINRMVHAVAEGAGDSSVSVDEFLRELEKLGSEEVSGSAPDLSEFVDVPEGLTEVLSEYEEHRFRDNIEREVPLYRVICHLPFDTFDVRLRDLSEGIREVGELLTTLPQTDGVAEGTIGFQLYFTAREDGERLRDRLQSDGVSLEQVLYRQRRPQTMADSFALEASEGPEGERGYFEDEIKGVSNTVRVDIAKLDNLMNLVGELVILRSNFTSIAGRLREILFDVGSDSLLELEKTSVQMEKMLIDLRDGVMDIRMVPMGQLFSRLQRVSKKIARELNKKVNFEFSGGDTELDKMIMEEMVSPLLHMVRNSIDHGIENSEERKAKGKRETGMVRLSAYQQGNHVVLEVEDDGAGIDLEGVRRSAIRRGVLREGEELSEEDILSLLFKPGFSTKETVTGISGRGVGMDVVRKEIENIGGAVEVHSVKDRGTRVTLTLPITLAILQALLVRTGSRVFAIPMGSILETIQLESGDIRTMQGIEVVNLRDRTLPLLRLENIFELPRADDGNETYAVIIGMGNRIMGLVAQELLGKQDIVIKPLGEAFAKSVGLAGAAELGDQSTVLVLDVAGLMLEAIRLGGLGKRV
ncbi:MAG: chemotaxis protein CheA [bacterium]|nr:MAG: chemotaxis protein CheA [bacterium]